MNRKEVEIGFERINIREGWMTQYNVDHQFSSPYRVHEMMRPISYLPGSLRSLESQFKKVLLHYFDLYTTEEWLEQHVDPLTKIVEEINSRAVALTSSMTWPRRPLVSEQAIKDRNLENEIEITPPTTTSTTEESAGKSSSVEDTAKDTV